MLRFCHQCAMYWQFNFMLELFSPLNIDLNSYTNVFVFKGRKHHFIRVVEFIIICKTVYILKHTAMYLGITQWHIAYIQPTE